MRWQHQHTKQARGHQEKGGTGQHDTQTGSAGRRLPAAAYAAQDGSAGHVGWGVQYRKPPRQRQTMTAGFNQPGA